MANQIVEKANSIALRVTYEYLTMGDGNCFYRAVFKKMENRDDIKDYFGQSNKYFSNYRELCTPKHIQGYKSLYEASIHLKNRNMNWL